MSKIKSWAIEIELDNNKTQKIVNVPNNVAQTIDDFLTELESD